VHEIDIVLSERFILARRVMACCTGECSIMNEAKSNRERRVSCMLSRVLNIVGITLIDRHPTSWDFMSIGPRAMEASKLDDVKTLQGE
jgi:hypothetical protein